MIRQEIISWKNQKNYTKHSSRSIRNLFFFLLSLIVFGSCNEGKQEITLNVIGEALPPLESLGSLSSEYEEKTGVKIKIHPFEFETALQKTQLDFASGNGEYDIVMGIFYNHGKYAKNNYIIPFSRLEGVPYLDAIKVSENNFYPALQKTVMEYNGETVGYPFSAQTMFLWYRKDLFSNEEERINFFERYGYELPLPDEENLLNWTQYKDLAEFFTRKVGVKLAGKNLSQDFYGTTLQLKRHPCSLYEFTNFVYSFGGQFFDESGDPVINSNANIEALEYYLSLRQFCPPGVTQFTWDDALAQMQQGKIAMTIMWSDAPSSLDNPRESKVVGKVGYSLVPIKEGVNKKVSVFGGWAFMINNDTKYPEEAYKFIQWACSPKFQLKWAKSGGLPASKNIFEDPEYLAIPYMKAQNEALKNLVAWPREPGAEEFISDGILALSKAASDEESATESLNNLQSLQERK